MRSETNILLWLRQSRFVCVEFGVVGSVVGYAWEIFDAISSMRSNDEDMKDLRMECDSLAATVDLVKNKIVQVPRDQQEILKEYVRSTEKLMRSIRDSLVSFDSTFFDMCGFCGIEMHPVAIRIRHAIQAKAHNTNVEGLRVKMHRANCGEWNMF